jgi:hypothetical protein
MVVHTQKYVNDHTHTVSDVLKQFSKSFILEASDNNNSG